MPDDNIAQRCDLLTTALVGALLPNDVPEGHMIRAWLNSWAGHRPRGHRNGASRARSAAHALRRRGLAGDVLRRGAGTRSRHRDGLGADALAKPSRRRRWRRFGS